VCDKSLTAGFPRVVSVCGIAHPGEEVGVVRADSAEDVVFKVENAEAGAES
jgi:hypothetical protein